MQQSSPQKQRRAKPLDARGILAVAVCLTLLLLVGVASVRQSAMSSALLKRAYETRQARSDIAAINLAMQEAETAQRGYLLTMDEAYLGPFADAMRVLPRLTANIEARHPASLDLAGFGQVLARKQEELQHTIALAKAGDMDGALRVVRTNTGDDDMRQIRHDVAAYEGELDGTIANAVGRLATTGRLLVILDVVSLLMILALASVIGFGLRRYLRELAEAHRRAGAAYAELEHANERLDEAVRERTAELTAANEEIQRFAYIVSHDLRAPLVNIMGFTGELEQATATVARHLDGVGGEGLREVVQEEMAEALRFIRSSTAKMDRLINAILRLSREGRRVLTPETLPMATMLRGMIDSMQHQAVAKGATVAVGEVPDIVSDRLAIEQVFSNIIENALKYLSPGRPGQVSVRGRAQGRIARFEIEDNGRGIAERDYERIFELFRRAGDQSIAGEGIGLAHVRALVRRLGGRIECRSVLGSGTVFTILLPTEPRQAIREPAA